MAKNKYCKQCGREIGNAVHEMYGVFCSSGCSFNYRNQNPGKAKASRVSGFVILGFIFGYVLMELIK